MKHKVQTFPEECCELCMETIHTHFTCPNCKDDYAGTDCYGNLYKDDIFQCEECEAKYKYLGRDDNWEEYVEDIV